MTNPYDTFDSKNNCWICLKPFTEHTEKDWAECDKKNAERGKVIDKLGKLIEEMKKE